MLPNKERANRVGARHDAQSPPTIEKATAPLSTLSRRGDKVHVPASRIDCSYSWTPMLRARGKGTSARWPVETAPDMWFPPGGMAKLRLRVARRRCLCVCLVVLLIALGGLLGRSRRSGEQPGLHAVNRTTNHETTHGHTSLNDTRIPEDPPKPPWKYPLVDREVLRKLERMQQFYAPDYYDLHATSTPAPDRSRWPPTVTDVPERPSRGNTQHVKAGGADAICESAVHPRACRFLLPLRVAEQESKARIHLTQIARLARALNRTLVLPKVGKSKIGACFKWGFDTYYDAASLDGDRESFVDLEHFRGWLGGEAARSQLVSVGSALPAHTSFRVGPVYANEDVSVLAYDTFGTWERDLPGCFAGRFAGLALETMPVFMSAQNTTNKDGSVRPIGPSIVDAFSAISSRNTTPWDQPAYDALHEFDNLDSRLISMASPEAQVLVVNWDLRHPIFLPSAKSQLEYSKRMHNLAVKYAPKDPYLVVQWRMESVDPELLEDCAHSLVDVLSRLLHDSVLAVNVTSIWFASDYPYPIVERGSSQRRPELIAKSGTFRDFDTRHEKAVEILRSAFNKQGELGNWTLTDFAEVIAAGKGGETELLHDSGALAILDKLVSMKAVLFVSGASRCSRRRYAFKSVIDRSLDADDSSSFTKQVVDARVEEGRRVGSSNLRNVVEVFG